MLKKYKIPPTLLKLIKDKCCFTKNDYILCVIAIFGYEPKKSEILSVFEENETLSKDEIEKILSEKMQFMNKHDVFYYDIFKELDHNGISKHL